MFKEMVSRLRAAYGLSFAMVAGKKPRPADLEDAGLSGADWKRLAARFDERELRRLEEPGAAPRDASPGLPVGERREWPVSHGIAGA